MTRRRVRGELARRRATRLGVWRPPVEQMATEPAVVGAIRRAKLFALLREHRHKLREAGFQVELAALDADRPKGQPPLPPAQLALATIVPACTGASDDEAVEAPVVDRRRHLVAGHLGAKPVGFGNAAPVRFRARLVGHFLGSWGEGVFTRPHGITITKDDLVYCTDDKDHTVRIFTLDGTVPRTIGTPHQPSSSGYIDGGPTALTTIERGAGPFNRPTRVFQAPSGELYITEGHGNPRRLVQRAAA